MVYHLGFGVVFSLNWVTGSAFYQRCLCICYHFSLHTLLSIVNTITQLSHCHIMIVIIVDLIVTLLLLL